MTFENIKINYTNGNSRDNVGFGYDMANRVGTITINNCEIYGT